MGLDMFFFASKEVPADVREAELNEEASTGTGVQEKYNMKEIQYFRKHSDLHGFIEDYWCRYTKDDCCNCKYVEITHQLLDLIRRMAENPPTEHSQGFFWGQSEPEDWEDTLKMCNEIEKLFKNRNRVFYYAWY